MKDTGKRIEPWSGELLALAELLREDLLATRALYEEARRDKI